MHSRGSSLEGTIIVQPFDSSKLTGGISGSLRQEFRELELLDEITKMRYLGTISPKVVGITRNELIHSFRKWKGDKYMPKSMHAAIQWSSGDPFPIEPVIEDSPWTVVKANAQSGTTGSNDSIKTQKQRKMSTFVSAQGSQPVAVTKSTEKRKRQDGEETTKKRIVKRIKVGNPPPGKHFYGLAWDNVNHSCAYDSLLTILLSIYTECGDQWRATVPQHNRTLGHLGELFHQAIFNNQMSLTAVRDQFREMLGGVSSDLGCKGSEPTDIYYLIKTVLAVDEAVIQYHKCRACDYESDLL